VVSGDSRDCLSIRARTPVRHDGPVVGLRTPAGSDGGASGRFEVGEDGN